MNNLYTMISSAIAGEKATAENKLLNNERLVSSEQFMPVSHTTIEGTNLPVWHVRFEALKTDNPFDFCLEIKDDIILGVEDAESDVVNLSHYNRKILGVSRRHLKLSPTETDLLITDLASTNGARKNGRFIQPNTPYSICNGDILELGDLILSVNIVKTPHARFDVRDDPRNIVNAYTHISTALTSNLSTDAVLDRILEMAANLCRTDEIALFLWNEQAHELTLRSERGMGNAKTRLAKICIEKDLPVSEVLRTGEPSRSKITNGQKHEIMRGHQADAVLYAPITAGEVSLGVLIAARRIKAIDFTQEDERLLCTMGKFAAVAIQDSRKYEASNLTLQSKLDELSAYNNISKALSKTNNLTGIYSVLRNQVREHWKVENIGLWLVEEATDKLVPFPKPSFHKTYSMGQELIGEVASRAEAILATDIKLFSEPTKTLEPTLQLLARSAACVPIIENSNVLGVLAVFSTNENEFDEKDINLLQAFSQAAATAIRNAWLFEQVDNQRATILAAVNMLPHPMMIVDQDGKIIVSNKAADVMLNELHSSQNGKEGSHGGFAMHLTTLMSGLSESKWRTKEIIVGNKVYIATLEYASMIGTIILMQDVTDPVTGTSNHRHFHDLAEQAFQQSKRYTKPLAALIIGLDDLRRVINEQGHAVGDQILKGLASELRSFLRTPDILGRYHENEFVVILPETNLESTRVVAERIVRLMSKKNIVAENYKMASRLSIGLAMLDLEKDNSVDVFMEKAYEAFMLAKNDSKCRIKIHEDAG